MTVAEICIAVYVAAAIPGTVLIWAALVASKRRIQRAKSARPAYSLKQGSFHERHIRQSRLHL